MKSALEMFLDLVTVQLGLTSVFKNCGLIRSQVKVLNRKHFSQISTFPSEIVTCQLDNAHSLGDRQYWDQSDRNSRHWLFEEIRIHSERLGII